MAKAIGVHGFGDFDKITLDDVPMPEPKEGEVLIEIFLRPVNPTDVLYCRGAWGTHFPLPLTPGSDGVGRVVKNGPGASKFQPGQRVVAVQWPQFEGHGSWRTHAALPEKILFAVPDGVDDKTAAQFFINPVTVYGMLKELAVPQGKWLLQTAANSALGHQVVSLAKHYGVKTINIVRRSEAVQQLKDAGADEVICSADTPDIAARVKEITGGEGAYAALDAVGGKLAGQVLASLRPEGVQLMYGLLDPEPMQLAAMDVVGSRKCLRGFLIYNWIERPDKAEVVAEVFKLLEQKTIMPFLGEAFPLDKFRDAIEKSTTVGHGGKVFLQG